MEQMINATARAVLEKRPALEALLNAFAAFFIQKARLVEDLRKDSSLVGLDPSVARVAEGVPICTAMDFERLNPALKHAFDALLPILKTTFPAMEPEIDALERAFQTESIDLALLADGHLNGDPGPCETHSRNLGINVGSLEFVVGLTVATVLEAIEPLLAKKSRAIAWQEGCCPICGSLPSISYLAAATDLSSEFLKGGGGQKYLHCSHCSHQWQIQRNRCPACGNEDPDLLVYYKVPEEPAERVDICRKCRLYLPCIDLREIDIQPHMDMAAVGMVHLDAYAQKDGFKPMTWTPWNRMD